MAFARRGTQQVITQNSVAATSLSVSLPGAATATDSLIVQVSTTEATPGALGVTDNQSGNVYALDKIGSQVNVGGARVGIYSCPSINASGTFTVTYSGASGNFAIALSEYSGGPTTLDKTAAGGSNSTTNSETTSTTAAVSQSAELGIAAISHDDGTETYTVTAPYTKVVDNGASGSNSVTMVMADRIISAGGTQVCAVTTNGSTATYDACIATYYAAAATTGWPVQGTSNHPGQSPGLASAGSGRFQTNWWPYSPPATPTDVTVALTGVQGAGAVGSVAVAFDLAQTGVVGTGSVGTVVPGISASVTGNTGTSSVGSVAITNSPALVGVGGTGSVGSVAPLSGVPLAGTTATGSVGTLSPGSSLALTGNAGTGSVGTLAPSFDIGLSGVEGDSAVGTIVASVPGDVTVSLTGVEATSAVGTLTVSTDVVVPFVIGGGWIPLHKKKKKKKKPVIELDHVVIIPQETPDLDDKRIYRYVGDLSSELKNIRIQMVEAQDALEIAVRENKRIRNDEELLILLSI